MKKAVVYDSVTGNTEAMAMAIAEGAEESGADVYLARADQADIEEMLSCSVIYLGCPAMGVETVGDAQTDLCSKVRMRFAGKKVALFGSCAHGEGIWIRAWSSRLHGFGAEVLNWPGLMCILRPDREMLERCRKLGASYRSLLYILILYGNTMIITYWSDFTCPFCYIAETRLGRALRDLGIEEEARLDFKAFELNPDASKVPKRNVVQGFMRHYGLSEEAARAHIGRIDDMAHAEGLEFSYGTAHVTNTFDALRLVKFAQSKGYALGHRFIDRAYKAFFAENLILSDRDVLLRIASEAGLDIGESASVLDSGMFADAVRTDENGSRQYGITAVPYFVINGRYAIPGAAETSDFKKVLMKAYSEEEDVSSASGMVCGPDGCRHSRSCLNTLELQQSFLPPDARGIASQSPPGAYHAVAWDYDAHRIAADCTSHCLGGHPFSAIRQGRCDAAVGDSGAVWYIG